MCKFFCGLFKKAQSHEQQRTIPISPHGVSHPVTLETPPGIATKTHYTKEETLALALAFGKRWEQLSVGDGMQVFADFFSSESGSPRP